MCAGKRKGADENYGQTGLNTFANPSKTVVKQGKVYQPEAFTEQQMHRENEELTRENMELRVKVLYCTVEVFVAILQTFVQFYGEKRLKKCVLWKCKLIVYRITSAVLEYDVSSS
jgi:hypothetical protein